LEDKHAMMMDANSRLAKNGLPVQTAGVIPVVAPVPSNEDNTHKKNPVCLDPGLIKEAWKTEDLVKLAFKEEEAKALANLNMGNNQANVTSLQHSSRIMVSARESRQGREMQRYERDSNTNQMIRLVTGCVPILKGGNIMFVTASRKSEWILPKGGWEKDEEMWKSATRETHEEAGVLGILGPKLTEIEYETRKAKKRRLEQEEHKQKNESSLTDTSDVEQVSLSSMANQNSGTTTPEAKTVGAVLTEEVINRIPNESASTRASDETCSVASIRSDASQQYSLVRLSLYPLYVTSVESSWPESGRLRKLVNIDEALRMMEQRTEFYKSLLEVKEKGLHLVREASQTEK